MSEETINKVIITKRKLDDLAEAVQQKTVFHNPITINQMTTAIQGLHLARTYMATITEPNTGSNGPYIEYNGTIYKQGFFSFYAGDTCKIYANSGNNNQGIVYDNFEQVLGETDTNNPYYVFCLPGNDISLQLLSGEDQGQVWILYPIRQITQNGVDDVYGYRMVDVQVPVPSGYIQPAGTTTITTNGIHNVNNYKTANVNVPIPSGYIQPAGTTNITSNGTYNVMNYASANVNVPIPSGYIQPAGTTNITTNGTHNVTNYASAEVNVQPNLEPNRTITPSATAQIITPGTYEETNGSTTVTKQYDGLSQVTVEAIKPYPYLVTISQLIKDDYNGYILYKGNRYPDSLNASNPLLLVNPGDNIQIVIPNQKDYEITEGETVIASGTGNIDFTYTINNIFPDIHIYEETETQQLKLYITNFIPETSFYFGASQSEGHINVLVSSEPFTQLSNYISACSFDQYAGGGRSSVGGSIFIPIGAYVSVYISLSDLNYSININDIRIETSDEVDQFEDFDLNSFNDISITAENTDSTNAIFHITYKNNIPISISCSIVG